MAVKTELELQLQEFYGNKPPKQENGITELNEFDDKVMKKYQDMANTRGDYSIINSACFATPTIGEMIEEDLTYNIYKKIEGEVTGDPTEEAILKRAFFSEAPISTELGYHPDKNVFIVKFSEINQSKTDWQLNAIDGDTVTIDTAKIDDGNTGFTLNGIRYESFKHYCESFGSGDEIGIRYAGIDTPEIPHLSTQYISEKSIIKVKYEDIRKNADSNVDYRYIKYPITKDGKDVKKVWDADQKDMSTWKARKRRDDEILYFIKTENKDTKKITYNEVVDNFTPSNFPEKDGLKLKAIVTGDESSINKVVGGYRAKRFNKDFLNKTQDREFYLMINAGGIEPRKTTAKNKDISFSQWWFTGDNIEELVARWKRDIDDIGMTGIAYNAYGMDTYGRFLGTIYVKEKIKDEQGNYAETWINLAKYILSQDETNTIGQKDYTGSPELQEAANGLSDAFNLWSYDKNNIKWLDSFENMTKHSYEQKLRFHKEIVGYDFTKSRDCALMLGDTLFLIPPQSIRNISHNSYEKIATMRGKGSMVKANPTREHMLEIELFFYGEQGINGIPKDFVLPNGQKTTYYMNGLRSIVSQFKIAPFLPIENGYINDVLGIEAVTLMNLHIESVEGVPRLLKAILTLREFNYRVYMPDVPVDDNGYDGSDASKKLSELNPMFAKCFEWELFRYYYQRAIQQGERLRFIKDNMGFNSYDYSEYYYSKKNTLQPMGMCSSKVSFHVPDKAWLSEALTVKKDRDQNRTNILPVELTSNASKFLKELIPVYEYINSLENGDDSSFISNVANLVNEHDPANGKYVRIAPDKRGDGTAEIKDVLNGSQTSLLLFNEKDTSQNKADKYTIRNYISPIFSPMIETLKQKEGVYNVSLSEIYDKLSSKKTDIYKIIWRLKIKLDFSNISPEDINSIKETLSLAISKTFEKTNIKNEDILKDNSINIDFMMTFNPDTKELLSSNESKQITIQPTVDFKTLQVIGEQFSGKENQDKDDTSFNEHNQHLAFNVQDYKNPANMPFVPYITDVLVKRIGVSIGNQFTEISLKAVDGHAPQYMGGQDTSIELELLTDDKMTVSAINTLPSLAIDLTKDYRRIMSCWPIKVENELLQLMGVNEVLIDNIEISTVEGFPGLYTIFVRLTSVDRTQRQREALRKLDAAKNSGHIGTMNNKSDISIKSFFALDEALSKAELYPDLDLPTLEELAIKGYRFIKYSGKDRIYPDPDFYVVYSFPYTAMIIKDMVDKFLSKELFNPDADVNNGVTELIDDSGIQISKKVARTLGVETVEDSANGVAKKYSEIIKSAEEEMKKPEYQNFDKKSQELIENTNEINYILNYLTACDIQDGWQIKPGWKAPLCTYYTNQAVEDMSSPDATDEEKNNFYAKEIKELRKKAIELINKILDKPLNYNPDSSLFNSGKPMEQITDAVRNIFIEDKDGAELIKLLSPFDFKLDDIYIRDEGVPNGKTYFKTPHILRYIAGFAYAAGCEATGLEYFTPGEKGENWCPNQFVIGNDGKYEIALDKEGNKLKQNGSYIYMPRVEPNNVNKDFENARDYGIEFGMFKIKRYSTSEVGRIMKPYNQTISYAGDGDKLYNKKNTYPEGFLDPYYNKKGLTSDEVRQYKHSIMVNSKVGAMAVLRVMLVHLKKLILEGAFFSEIDIIAKDYDEITAAMKDANSIIDEYNKLQAMYADANEEIFINTLISKEEMAELLKNIPDSYNKSFCARMIYPFLSMVTENNQIYQQWINSRDYESLNILTGSLTPTSSKIEELDKFLKACSGIGMFEVDNKKDNKVSDSQRIINGLMKDVFITASEDPRLYVMHSFYDMLMNDKRGRLVRAFPTYYMVFVDEGRKLGSWKLHDNFYNMSAIHEIQVVKSRKVAADTCRIVMSNMYNSYAQDHDAETTQQYIDVYGLRDVFDSIFSPVKYYNKEEMLRNRLTTPDKVVIQPGVRIHVRMGYTSDGGKLPIVFNGKIAEVGVENVVEIIAQGDGHELTNPLNAFGALETTALQEAQKKITAFKDIRGKIARGGETPRNLLALILSAKHGGLLKNAMNEFLDGRIFNDNPFGIMHFGDPKMREIFEQGEVTQNLYEVSDSSLLKGVDSLTSEYSDKEASPTINTTLQDKTFWDLLHMCANSGLEYYGAIRDFGMRSTIFLGKANHYYAYAYDKLDGKIIEKRKPFQQYHHYDSYTDIVYNTIKATEKNMKTNAVGTWESSSVLWGRDQATTEPIYLDMNIYPEYQKSMTVNTGLLAAGNGGLIDIPIFNYLSEKWSTNANDDKVNKELAWRMTMNVLRQSVKDMYQGELCVIGDPSIKPYDRFFLTDSYEDMEGQMEVESVVYAMNIETGFTTTIIPDVIVRHNDPHELARQRLFGNFMTIAKLNIGVRLMLINRFASVDNKLMRAIGKSDLLYGLGGHLSKTASNLSNAVGLSKYADKNPALGRLLNKINSASGITMSEVNLTKITDLIDEMALFAINSLDLSNVDDILKLSKALELVGDLDIDEYKDAIIKIYGSNRGSLHMTDDVIKEALENIDNANDVINKAFSSAFKTDIIGNNGFVNLLDNYMKTNNIKQSAVVKDAIEIIKNEKDSKKVLKQLSRILKDDEVVNILKTNKDLSSKLRYFVDGAETLFKGAKDSTNFASKLKKLLKSDDIIDSLKLVFKIGSKFNVGTIAVELLKTAFTFVLAKNANEFLTRWIKSIQALTVYPITKNSRPLIAGMNGHKGSVFGAPPKDAYNSIQGWIMKAYDYFDGIPIIGGMILDELINRDVYDETVSQWKINLGISDTVETEIESEKFNQDLYNTISNELTSRMKTAHALKTRARIRKFIKTDEATKSYNFYKITGVKLSELSNNKELKKMIYIKDDPEILKALTNKSEAGVKMSLAHDEGKGTVVINFEDGPKSVNFIIKDNIYDLPVLREECVFIINRLLSQHELKNQVIHFMSGTRVNNVKTWKNTGFSFTIKCDKSNKLKKALEKVKEETTWAISEKNIQVLFEYEERDGNFIITAYAPSK